MTAVLGIQGRERTTFCGPVRLFTKVAQHVGMKGEDGLYFAVPSHSALLTVSHRAPRTPNGFEHWNRLKRRVALLQSYKGVFSP